ncbi:MAG TPA: hypothetical protein VHC22_13335 [Pirellulales bacterium]|nr:hypothetical protein [Pirellulales bacterium]
MNRSFITWLGLILIGVCEWFNYSRQRDARQNDIPWGGEGVSPLRVSTVQGTPKDDLHLLFIGNSYTSVHDIPKQVADIASSDSGNSTQLFVQSITRGGVTLKELWEEGKAADAIRSRHWDYVVIQEQSFWAITNIEASTDYMERFDKLAHQSGAKTVLYLTWPRKPGSHWYTDGQTAFLRTPDYMLHQFIRQTYTVSLITGASTADVGIYWWRVLKEYPQIELYEPDGTHQSMAGSYLAALVFYKMLTHRDVTRTTFLPAGVSETDADTLRTVVSQPLPMPGPAGQSLGHRQGRSNAAAGHSPPTQGRPTR